MAKWAELGGKPQTKMIFIPRCALLHQCLTFSLKSPKTWFSPNYLLDSTTSSPFLNFPGVLPSGGIWKGKCWTATKVLETLQNSDTQPLNHHIFFLWWNHDFSSSTWEAMSGREIPCCSCLQTQKYVFSMERHFSKRRNNCALASFSLELISWLKNTATEKCNFYYNIKY